MRGYTAFFKLRLITSLQYRTAALAGMTTQFFWGGMYLMIYAAFYANSSNVPISYNDLSTYIWLQQAFLTLIFFYMRDNDIAEMISSGGVAYELCRPYNLYIFWYIKLISQRIAAAALRFSPVLLFSIFLPAPYNLSAPASLPAFILFLMTLFLGLGIVVAGNMLMTLVTMITLEQSGVNAIFSTIWEFFSGNTIPIPLMPIFLQQIAFALPCRLVADLPFRIYSGHIPIGEGLNGMIIQLIWLVVLIVVGLQLLKTIEKRLIVQGG